MFRPELHARYSNGFTLIELLIVVAIIAILAAIAVPNFLEAQTRAKVSRTQSDMRSVGIALDSYNVDNGTYPIVTSGVNWYPLSARIRVLSTPLAYIASIPRDIFPDLKNSAFPSPTDVDTFDYYSKSSDAPGTDNATLFGRLWRLASAGPDLHQGWGDVPYDATNGTKSGGDIWLIQGGGNGWPYKNNV
ncbi:MAG TPA: prepilin-type N-terminal cleavage/methylation domain-containing protein [Candidatus Sumerlaeota bacterium]|nr:prepilin-type N-terminal cleavage/methylation domain-containing protein [Candidatus Sumerlaeota bacterium]HPS03062.1 prepilin-type N-terminal cleavage/methylation domain-containing protein [Candidatus Sumerlaeota bacterium]